MTVAWAAYRVLTPFLGALAPAARAFGAPEERRLWGERLGRVTVDQGCHAWVHAASLGEAGAVGPLARELLAVAPRARLHLTAQTLAGRARLAELGLSRSLAPLDTPQAVRRFFDCVRPRRLILLETELWPHWLMHARTRGVPVAVVSARLSERSVGRYRTLGTDFGRRVAELDAVLCQSADDRGRWLALGARPDRTEVVGNLKHDALPTRDASRAAARAAVGLDCDRPLLVLGSLRPGEGLRLSRAWAHLPAGLRDLWQVVAVPRHVGASADLREEAIQSGGTLIAEGAPRGGAWRWDDRSGVLNGYYAAADLAFVGGSLLPYGGHNPIEPAAWGAAVMIGPHHDSQAEAVRALERHAAIWIARSEAELAGGLEELLSDPALCLARGRAARSAVEGLSGAAARAVARLEAWGLWPAD